MKIDFHINFSGQCQEALEFYQQLLGGSLELFTYEGSQASELVEEDWQEKIAHATLSINQMGLSGADVQPDQYEQPKGFQLLLQTSNEEESKRVFEAFSEGGTVVMPLQKTYWSPCYGIVTDRFQVPWEINCQST